MKINLKTELKSIVKHAPVYSLGNILSQLSGFFLIPVYTRVFTPADYGILQLVVLTADVIGIFAGLKITETMLRLYYEPDDPGQRKNILSTGLIMLAFVGILVLIPLMFSSNLLSDMIMNDASLGYLFRISFISLILNMLVQIPFSYLQIRERSILFVSLSVSKLILAISLNIYFVVYLRIGVFGIVLSTLITAVLYAIVTIPFLIKQVGIRFSWPHAKQILRYGLPYIPSALANRAIHASDRYFLRYYLSLADVGVYSLGYRIGSLIHNIFNVSLFRIMNVRIFDIHKSDDAPEIIAKMATYTMMFLFCIGLGLSLFAVDIVHIMVPEEYWGASRIIPAITLCYIIFASESFIVQPILLTKKTERISYVNLTSGALNVGINFLLIPYYGMMGAVIATFTAFSIKAIGLYFIGRKLYPIPYEWKRLCQIMIIALVLYALGTTFVDCEMYLRLLFNTVLWISFAPLLWLCGIINEEEKREAKSFFLNLLTNN